MDYLQGLVLERKRPVNRYDKESYIKARNIINGTDCANEIAEYAMWMEKVLRSN